MYEKANSVRSSDVDAPAWIHKYIIGRKGTIINSITQNMPKVHVEFSDKEDKIKIEGPPEEVEKAQEQIENMARDLVSRMTFVELHVDPKLFKHLIGKSGGNSEYTYYFVFITVYFKSIVSATFLFGVEKEEKRSCLIPNYHILSVIQHWFLVV